MALAAVVLLAGAVSLVVASRHGGPSDAGARRRPDPPRFSVIAPAPAAFSDTKAVASSYASRLLDGLAVPPSAAVTAERPPPGLVGPVQDLSGSIDAYRLWATPLPPAQVISYVEAHLPLDAKLGEIQTPTSAQIGVTAPPDGVPTAMMTVAAVATRGGSVLRADAMAAWFPARSVGEAVSVTDTAMTITQHPRAPGRPGVTSMALTEPADVTQIANLLNALPTVTSPAPDCTLLSKTTYTVSLARSPTATPDFVATEGCTDIAVAMAGGPAEALSDAPSFDDTLASYFADPPPGSLPIAAWPSPAPVAAHSAKSQAKTLLDRLEASFVAPPGASRRSGPPPAKLAKPASGIGPGPVVAADRVWIVPGSPLATIAFLKTHLVGGTALGDQGDAPNDPEPLSFDEDVTTTATNPVDLGEVGGVVTPEVIAGPANTSILRVDFEVRYGAARPSGEEIGAGDHYVSITETPGIGGPAPAPARMATFTDPATVVALATAFNDLLVVDTDGMQCGGLATYRVSFAPSAAARPDFVAVGVECDAWYPKVHGKASGQLENATAVSGLVRTLLG